MINRRRIIAAIAAVSTVAIANNTFANKPTANLNGRRIVYDVSGYHIQMEFLDANRLRWTYLSAPTPAEIGKSAVEAVEQVDLRPDLFLIAWTEKDGTQVVDVFDFTANKVFANFVMPDGKRYKSEATFERFK
jgi:hypothetical protein